jgi:hypothetical protein
MPIAALAYGFICEGKFTDDYSVGGSLLTSAMGCSTLDTRSIFVINFFVDSLNPIPLLAIVACSIIAGAGNVPVKFKPKGNTSSVEVDA